MDWRTTYPTMATMMEASFETLCTWLQKLPPPVNDVERAVSRRMIDRRNELLGQKVRANAPEIADRFNDILERCEKLGVKTPVGRM